MKSSYNLHRLHSAHQLLDVIPFKFQFVLPANEVKIQNSADLLRVMWFILPQNKTWVTK